MPKIINAKNNMKDAGELELLRKLCSQFGPSGDEGNMRDFLIDYVNHNKSTWAKQPELFYGDGLQDCLILKFGNPRTAVFAHIDSHGYTVRYEDQLVPIGSPHGESGTKLVGADQLGDIECELLIDKNQYSRYKFGRSIQPGTSLVFKSEWNETKTTVQSCYMDNRLGVYAMLKLAQTIQNGVIVFSTWEEHGGGSVPFLIKFLNEKWAITQALIADITWVTEGVQPGKGVVISMRDRNVPRQSFIRKIIDIVEKSNINYQVEVEGDGSSDGRELQLSPYPIDWCFIGAPEDHVHSPKETVHKSDIQSMIEVYSLLMNVL